MDDREREQQNTNNIVKAVAWTITGCAVLASTPMSPFIAAGAGIVLAAKWWKNRKAEGAQ